MNNEMLVKIIVSEDISSQQNGPNVSNIIVNPVLALRAPFVPTALSLAVTVLTSGISPNEPHRMEINITYADGNGDETPIYSTGENDFAIPGSSDNFNFNLDLKNIPFMDEGKYKVNFIFDDNVYSDVFSVVASQKLSK